MSLLLSLVEKTLDKCDPHTDSNSVTLSAFGGQRFYPGELRVWCLKVNQRKISRLSKGAENLSEIEG